MSTVCVSIFLYADYILLIAPSVSRLQTLVNICETELLNIWHVYWSNKSVCIRFGPRFNAHCEHITSVSGVKFEWVDNLQNLGIFFVRCSFDTVKSLFFTLFTSIFSKVGRFAPEEVVTNLLRTKCIPVLLYGMSFLYVINIRLTFL